MQFIVSQMYCGSGKGIIHYVGPAPV